MARLPITAIVLFNSRPRCRGCLSGTGERAGRRVYVGGDDRASVGGDYGDGSDSILRQEGSNGPAGRPILLGAAQRGRRYGKGYRHGAVVRYHRCNRRYRLGSENRLQPLLDGLVGRQGAYGDGGRRLRGCLRGRIDCGGSFGGDSASAENEEGDGQKE